MDTKQTRKEQDRQFQMLFACSTPIEQQQLVAARKDRSLRNAVIKLGKPSGVSQASPFRCMRVR